MIAVIQRVTRATVTVDHAKIGAINHGLVVLLGIQPEDDLTDIVWLSKKVCNLRVFNDQGVALKHSLIEANADLLVVSQFTLFASTKKGNRPSFSKAAPATIAEPLYSEFISHCHTLTGKPVQSGQFGADMKLELVNDGPVTIIIDSKDRK